ncbi:hypothetical protein [Nonomuraea fuscirosea]|uniref:hypothetical protein n=1 Tax=Nonomuraea fuscirosea TaxID=1291556 RepID=UPI0033CC9CC9
MSQVGRRLAQTTSALGLVGALVVLVCGVFVMATPTTAFAATKTFSYTCQSGGPYTVTTGTPLTVTLTAPTSVTAGQTFDLTVGIPALTLATGSVPQAATTVAVNLALTPSGGTVTEPTTPKPGAAITANQAAVPAGSATYKVAVNSTTTGKISLDPGDLKLGLTSATSAATTNCTTTSTEVLDVPIGTGGGGGTGTDLVEYECVGPEDSDVQDVEIKVELTMPTTAKVNEQFAIKWKGTYTTGKELKAPTTGQTIPAKIFAYASLTGITGLTSATGEGTTGTITAGSTIPLPTTAFDMKTTASTAGTATVKPADVNFGANTATGNNPAIACKVQNATELKSYTLTVGSGTTSPSPTTTSPTASPTTTSPRPTTTRTATLTITPSKTRKSQTPKAGADTGAGGTMGPDGRVFILTGTGLVAAAAIGGLVMRRRSVKG